MSRPFLRRLAIVFAASVVLSGIGGAQAEEVLRIGFQKSSTLLTLIRSQGTFERELARQGIRVSWHEFPSGLPLLESLNVGNVDLSADVADTVPVFAQAAGARLTYFARETPSPAAQAILVGEHSPLKSLAELKGKRIAVTKAAGSHYLLIAALASAGLEFSDIQPAYLTPADGRAAFENGKVDAWVTWDPYVASAQRQQRARVLADGQGLASYQRYYLASSDYARKHPEVLQQVFAELAAHRALAQEPPGRRGQGAGAAVGQSRCRYRRAGECAAQLRRTTGERRWSRRATAHRRRLPRPGTATQTGGCARRGGMAAAALSGAAAL